MSSDVYLGVCVRVAHIMLSLNICVDNCYIYYCNANFDVHEEIYMTNIGGHVLKLGLGYGQWLRKRIDM